MSGETTTSVKIGESIDVANFLKAEEDKAMLVL
jgi:hypothetical protein